MKFVGNVIEFACCMAVVSPFIGLGGAFFAAVGERLLLDALANDSYNRSRNRTETDYSSADY